MCRPAMMPTKSGSVDGISIPKMSVESPIIPGVLATSAATSWRTLERTLLSDVECLCKAALMAVARHERRHFRRQLLCVLLERNAFSSNRHLAPANWRRMIFSKNRHPLFRDHALGVRTIRGHEGADLGGRREDHRGAVTHHSRAKNGGRARLRSLAARIGLEAQIPLPEAERSTVRG